MSAYMYVKPKNAVFTFAYMYTEAKNAVFAFADMYAEAKNGVGVLVLSFSLYSENCFMITLWKTEEPQPVVLTKNRPIRKFHHDSVVFLRQIVQLYGT